MHNCCKISVYKLVQLVQFKCHNSRDLRTFLGVKLSLKVLLRVKELTFCNSVAVNVEATIEDRSLARLVKWVFWSSSGHLLKSIAEPSLLPQFACSDKFKPVTSSSSSALFCSIRPNIYVCILGNKKHHWMPRGFSNDEHSMFTSF